MLRGVIFGVDGINMESGQRYGEVAGIGELVESLNDNGVKVAVVSPLSEMEILKTLEESEVSVEECIMITDSEDGVNISCGMDIPVIGFLPQGSVGGDFSKAVILIEGFEEVDYAFVNRAYERVHHIPWKIAETSRCIIRESALEDLEKFYEIYDGEGMEYIEPLSDYKTEQEKLRAYIEYRYPFYEYGMWTVLDKQSGKVIGRAGIEEREIGGEEKTELGYVLHHLYRRKGIGAEICQAILEYAKSALYMEEIHAFTHIENTISQKLLFHLGFRFCEDTASRAVNLEHYYKKL